ncbi:flavin reductase family protein [Nocardiopsis sp. NPDC058631]|uniref:flavin reductase family protein n=1 Tax=Nocardiopsis sp. NPDC058631 TaxID=3346566 RepID=UPI003660AD82
MPRTNGPAADTAGVRTGAAGLFSVMAAFPTGVAIVTTTAEHGRPVGLTTTALCSVSARPPLLLVSIGERSRTLPWLRERRRFLVHVMGGDGAAGVCARFASADGDKFAGTPWRYTGSGLPLLEDDVIAWGECETEQEVEAGDHTVIVGRYLGGERLGGPGPLVYHARTYRDTPWG